MKRETTTNYPRKDGNKGAADAAAKIHHYACKPKMKESGVKKKGCSGEIFTLAGVQSPTSPLEAAIFNEVE